VAALRFPVGRQVIVQAAGLALLSALSPTALLVAAVYLGSARPTLTSLFYLAGAVGMSLVMGVVVLVALRSADLNHPDQHAPRYGLRLGLGLVLLAAALLMAARKPQPPDPGKPRQGIVSRMVADPAPLSAFAVGLLVFAPGVTFIAALQVIATASADFKLTLLAVLVVVVINVLLVWLPITLHLVAPNVTEHRLTAFNGWLRAQGRTVLVGVFVAVGGIMIVDGIYGLVSGAR
jgi:Sap, sulfolipid-1-addressing protein